MADHSYWQGISARYIRRRSLLRGASSLALGSAALALLACGSDNGGGSAKPQQPEDKSGLLSKPEDTTAKAVKGGVWPSSFQADTPHFDGMVGGSGPWFENHFAYGYLLKAPVFNKLKGEQIDTSVVGDVAESWEQSPDGLQITFKIRANAGLDPRPPTNGRMMDAQDVVFAWNRFRSVSTNRGLLANEINKSAPIVSMTATDARTVVVKLASRSASALQSLADYRNLVLHPRESEGGFDPRRDMRGSGPWMLSEYKPSSGFTYARNPNFYDKTRPFMDGIERPIISEYAAGLAQFRAGHLATWAVRPEDILAVKQDVPKLNMLQADQYQATNRTIGFSYKPESPFRDERVRHAASMLIDRDLFIETTANAAEFRKKGIPIETVWFTILTGSDVPFFIDPQSKEFGEDAKWLKHDAAEAKKLIKAAGKDTIQDKWWYTTNGYNASYLSEQEILKGMLEANGDFKFAVQPVDFNTVFTPRIRFGDSSGHRPDFDGAAYFNFPGAPDPDLIFGANYMPGSTEYRFEPDWPNDTKYEQMMQQQRTELDPKKRIAIIHDIQRHHASKAYSLPRPGDAKGFNLWWPYMKNLNVYSNRLSAPLANNIWLQYWIDKTQMP